jgi:CRISPR-associated protein Cas2
MSRTRYIVSYDIAHPKRLRRIAKVMQSYGHRIQYSVFECPLDPLRLAHCRMEIDAIIHHEEDQVLFIALGPSANDASLHIEALGLPYLQSTRITIL